MARSNNPTKWDIADALGAKGVVVAQVQLDPGAMSTTIRNRIDKWLKTGEVLVGRGRSSQTCKLARIIARTFGVSHGTHNFWNKNFVTVHNPVCAVEMRDVANAELVRLKLEDNLGSGRERQFKTFIEELDRAAYTMSDKMSGERVMVPRWWLLSETDARIDEIERQHRPVIDPHRGNVRRALEALHGGKPFEISVPPTYF